MTGVARAAVGGADRRTATSVISVELDVCPPSPARVWLFRLDVDSGALAGAEQSLTPAELERARRGIPQVYRRRVLLRAALREVLGRRLGVPGHAVPLHVAPTGRPELRGAGRLDLSCSASDRIGLVALADGYRVGVDVDRVTPWTADVLDEGWLSAPERTAIGALPPDRRAEAVARSWTQKEAVLKGRGTGLAGGPADVATPVGRAAGRIGNWETCAVAVPAGYVAALATTPLTVGGHDEQPADRVETARSENTLP